MREHLYIDGLASEVLFTICTLVTDQSVYRAMRESFKAGGFDLCSQYIFADNSSGTNWLPFMFMKECAALGLGKYFIFVHQDVLLLDDGVDQLKNQLDKLSLLDSSWKMAGNAGVTLDLKYAIRISDPRQVDVRVGNLPQKVVSLDENFIVLRGESVLCVPDIDFGFHHFASILVNALGGHKYSAYVIDFHIMHLSSGNINVEFYSQALKWSNWLRANGQSCLILTPCCAIIDSRNFGLARLFNSEVIYRRIMSRLGTLLHRWFTRNL